MLYYGGTPVPWTVAWTEEETDFRVGPCVHAGGRRSLLQAVAPGGGRPRFGKPHMQRQREAIGSALCDLCGRSLAARTKVSLSQARVRLNGAEGPCVMQVEPLLHRECAAISMRHCPSLKQQIVAGVLNIRQVTRYREQLTVMDEVYVESVTGIAVKAIGHAKIELVRWTDRGPAWLGSA